MDDPRFVTNAARNANRSALIDVLQEAFLTHTYEEWEAILLPAGIPVGSINTIDQSSRIPRWRREARWSSASIQWPAW